ncbi:dolichyl-phosphate-mannose-protein mannosyltransferase [Maribacter caenipelagi]|uniref:Dolichyl-phosphate-mannose-protein mannosyltransferase n=1 Tax=Maribacter caenipelagi TaxID=1447781 RepID=A0A4R7CW40_9FLAO|nr:glycosyltransferase family 39 protein [Maribacter caenipelagi]TDS12689.1 dolichyl-phosphate-mannose-protein mannosyltransferase [Maribacter caenipelagi]
MPLKRNEKAFLNFSELKNTAVFFLFFLITFFIRFPFFFRDYVDRDESTFILLGQSWADGFLPYTQLWDLKPPLTFAFFATIISIFGKSFIAIRLAGVFLVIITAFYTYKIALTLIPKKASIFVGVFCIVLLSLFGSLQGVMSEHICIALFVPAVYLLKTKESNAYVFLAGVLMGATIMVKLNMAFPILFIGLYLVYEVIITKKNSNFLSILLFGTGVLSIIFATIIPYFLSDQTYIWWESVVLAPLEYTGARRYSIIKLAPIFVITGLFLVYAYKSKKLDFKNRTVQLLLVAIFGVLFSFVKGGRINGHYLIQLHPMLLILVGIVIYNLTVQYKPKLPVYLSFIALLIPAESYLEYVNIIKNKIEKGTFFNGEGFSVPQYIIEHKLDTENILFFEYHIGYWNLETLPPTTASTHPSNICRDELFPFFYNPRKNSIEELEYIMEELQPKTVIIRKGRRILDKKEVEENKYLDTYLAQHYKLFATVDNAEILQRL